jgi:two-component sensor histidine kinase
MLVALAAALPLLLLTAGIVWQLAENERQNRREAVLFSTRALMNVVDAMLSKHVAIAQSLAKSPALLSDDLAAFRQEAERALPGLSGGWVVVSDADGQQIVNLLRRPDDPLPRRNPQALEFQRRALETGQIQISGVFTATLLPVPIVTVEVPVVRPGKPPLALSLIMDTRAFLPLLDQRELPEGWLAGLIDRSGNFIARSRNHDRTVGQPASQGFRAAALSNKEGWNEMKSIDGNVISNGHVTSDLSGWVMGLAADREVFEAPIRRTTLVGSLAGGAATFLSVMLAMFAARKIARAIEKIEQGTHARLRRAPVSFAPTDVPEVDRALAAFSSAASVLEQHEKERDERESHIRLIMRELSHRSKNLLAIVLAIARQTARHTQSFDEFEKSFSARIQALADAHDLLVEQQWVGAPLEELVRAQLQAFGLDRISYSGQPIALRSEAVQNVALALHELATNASKHGSLSVPEGRVSIDWALNGNDPKTWTLRLTWRESGGPPVKPPTRTGFGRFVLERVTVNALGSGTLEFNESGLIWTCEITAEHLVDRLPRPRGLTGGLPSRPKFEGVERRAS